jgi:phospholipase C
MGEKFGARLRRRRREAVILVACLSVLVVGAVVTEAPRSSTATPIKHVIIIMQENHSFDNYFGTYPTANGTLVTPITSQLPAVNGIPDGVCLPFLTSCISPSLTTAPDPANPREGQVVYEDDYANNGTGFPANSGEQSMVYFDYHSIPAYWDYAEEYGLADNYFAPVLGETNANRLMLLAGNSPITGDDGPPPYMPYNETVLSQLDKAGVSWRYFDWVDTNGSQSNVIPMRYISGPTPQAKSDIQDIPTFLKDLANSSALPDVSFVSSLNNRTYDEHPPSDPTTGEQWVVSLVNEVMNSSYWGSTAIFLTEDEGGGFYDHVIPPSEFSISNANFTTPLLGLGERIPLLVISPYSREAYVSNTLMSHLSLTHFIEYNWRLPALNANIGNAALPLGFFDFSQHPRPPIILGTSGPSSMSTYPIPLQMPLR